MTLYKYGWHNLTISSYFAKPKQLSIMNISILDSYERISQQAASLIIKQLREKKNLLLCAATGNTPTRTYQLLVQEYAHHPKLFSELRVIKLDEWGGIPLNDPATCETYLQENLIKPLHIKGSGYFAFNSQPKDRERECKQRQVELDENGPIDVCFLGLGLNGHIALNEPSISLEPHIHVARLSETTLQHSMVEAMGTKPSFGLTLGIADILHSKSIILMISGSNKREIVQTLLAGNVTTALPASFLWLHPNVTCLLDKEAGGQ